MKTTLLRFLVAGLIVASVGFLIFYYFTAPDPALSTYNELVNLTQEEEYTNFYTELEGMKATYIDGAEIISAYQIAQEALDNNFNYYKSYLLFVSNVTGSEQSALNGKLEEYSIALKESYRLVTYFNDYGTGLTYEGMHANFIGIYNTQIKLYVELVELLKNYVIDYAFNGTLPVGLKQTLLQVQLDYAKVVIVEELDNNLTNTILTNELNAIENKYVSYLNAPQGSNTNANQFIEAYANFINLQEYLESQTKDTYVLAYVGDQANYLNIIHSFLNLSSYN